MKIEKVFLGRPQNQAAPVAIDTLHLRMATELNELACICGEVENALGEIIANPGTPFDEPIMTLQGLDRIRQSLEDMARLTRLLSKNNHSNPLASISSDEVRKNIVLGGLAERLVNSAEVIENDALSDQDVIWES